MLAPLTFAQRLEKGADMRWVMRRGSRLKVKDISYSVSPLASGGVDQERCVKIIPRFPRKTN